MRGFLGSAALAIVRVPPLAASSPTSSIWVTIRPQGSSSRAAEIVFGPFPEISLDPTNFGPKAELPIDRSQLIITPGPGRLTKSLGSSNLDLDSQKFNSQLLGSIGLDLKCKAFYSEALERGLRPISFSTYGLIFRPSVHNQLKFDLSRMSTWKARLDNLASIRKKIQPLSLGNLDGLTGLYFFSTALLAENGGLFHYQLLQGKATLTLPKVIKTLKRMQTFLQFTNKDIARISQDESFDRVLDGKSAMTLDWTAILKTIDLWQAQDLAFRSFNPISLVNPLGYECESFSYFVHPPMISAGELNADISKGLFGASHLRALSDTFPSVYFLNIKREPQWPGLANQIANLRSSRLLPVPSWALNMADVATENRIKSILYDFIANPSDKNLTKCAKAIVA